MIELGTLLIKRDNSNELDEPIFVWEILQQNEKSTFIVNSESGISKNNIINKFPDQKVLLPNHAKFKLMSQEALETSFIQSPAPSYIIVSDWIKLAKDQKNMAPDFFINAAYGGMHLNHIRKFTESQYCKTAEDKIHEDPYSRIVKLSSIKDVEEQQKQNLRNLSYILTLDFIPKRFVFVKIITIAKDIMRENFPPENDGFSNSLIEKLLLGMFLSYYKANRDKIKSVTVNYGQKFPGDFKVFQQFTSMLNKFDDEINMYENINEQELKMELNAALSGAKLPEREDGKGIIMKLLEFDLAFWQRLILLNIDSDVPVRKPYKDGFSISYNYMLLLPFFQWLAPHLFPQYEDKTVNAETYNKVVVERMKSFVEGKIS